MNPFARLLIKKTENPKNEKTREACGKRAGILGIILNTILAGAKITLGALSGAVSVLADGLNNLTDCGSNVVSIIGLKVSNKPADKEHPFGHQRAETISALLIAVIIMVVAVELIISSIEKIISPTASVFSIYLVIILGVSILVKFFMFLVNKGLSKETGSQSLSATAADSISDAVATTVVLICLLISYYTGVELDAYAGIGVAIFIGFTGIKLLIETISHLLGKAPDSQTVIEIKDRVMAFDDVCGIHDLNVHTYGQNKMYATVHVEVNCKMPIMSAHQLADEIERDFIDNTDVILTVHIDPLVLDDPMTNSLKELTEECVSCVDQTFKIHDFRVVGGDTKSNVVFDVAVPFDCKLKDEEITQKITQTITERNNSLGVVLVVERQNLV